MMRKWQRYWARNLIAVLVGVVVFTLANWSPLLWDSALLAGWDVGVITWLALTFLVIKGADAQHTWEQSQALEPDTLYVLVIVVITAAVGLVGAVALSTHMAGRSPIEQNLHFASGALAVALAWLLVHTAFGLYYARLYYDEKGSDTDAASADDSAPVPFCKGLEFPEGELVDYWAFIYYSFTIAMCYQTSDVTITGPWMRRMTLLHAIVSFAFVLVILGYTVNAVNTLL
jgi:uncharacterized membrane protein